MCGNILQALANLVTEDDLQKGSIYPPLTDIMNVSIKIAAKVVEYSYMKGEYYIFKFCNLVFDLLLFVMWYYRL